MYRILNILIAIMWTINVVILVVSDKPITLVDALIPMILIIAYSIAEALEAE
ncbi:Uncharacterised protein [Niallia circulans]|uniref:hypothetical protein n=1 Tax=Niallia circulans TaxID=1397 RepID=UPI000AA8FD37|nr:hypothetical protein [Niallia circulans]MED3839323.1 hypothetical protein [Niallia circulans]MED4245306.1 hypothetical protein [Niallia circulans]MED4250841.1 hypothetical protein [Niallia circulans]QKH60125.1 hypothetical protein FOC77_05385 [Niallia circulans]SPT82967.1 Uncharacterised protein [Niallia circulans]